MTRKSFLISILMTFASIIGMTAQSTADSVAGTLSAHSEWFSLQRFYDTHRDEMSHAMSVQTKRQLSEVFRRKKKWKTLKREIIIPFRTDSVGLGADRTVAIMIPATVNGRNADFMLDTGAGINVVTPAMAARLGLRMTNSEVEIEGSGKTVGRKAVADTLRAGNLMLRNVAFYVAGMTSGVDSLDRYMHHLDAIIGLPLIEKLQVCEIDFRHHLIKSTDENSNGEPNICYQPGYDILTMEAWHTGEPLHIIPDTGAGHSTLGSTYLRQHAAKMITDGIDSVQYAGYGGIISGHEYRLPDFEITVGGTYSILPLITAFDGDYDQRLGMDYFSRMERVIIDLRRMQIRVIKK